MTGRVILSRSAKQDLRAILQWMHPKSPVGTARWLARFEESMRYLAEHAGDCSAAEEAGLFEQPLQQHTFKARRGNSYRLIFVVRDSQTIILTIRGTGQDWLQPGDLELDH